jgi:cytidyltransferase-like protein
MALETIVLVSGGFDPLHSGHIRLLESARYIADGQGGKLIAGLNSDEWLARKKGRAFIPFMERMRVLGRIEYVNDVWQFDDSDGSARGLIRLARHRHPKSYLVFCNGGDRTAENIPEMDIVDPKLTFRFGVGGSDKSVASSDFLAKWREPVWVDRPWGRWAVVDEGKGYKVKRLEILPNKSISLQYHNKRGEHWTVVQGHALASINGKINTYGVGETFHVPLGKLHRVYNNGLGMLVCVEVQYGECLEEDIVRV